ncbi:MAG: hypothetical protein QOG08_1462 [Chloroflexota bacterium]|jgi:hypothetical protein|nr:hypothetical protein [Chloroflexota bacterium]
MSGQPNRPPPGAGSQSFEPAPPKPPAPTPPVGLRWLPFVFGAGAVFWLVQLTEFAAIVAAPAGRDQLDQALVQAGIKGDLSTLLVLEAVIFSFFLIVAAALHATAYFGLRARKPWGWIVAVIVAAAWSLLLVGIPVLLLLIRSNTRHAYGIR